MTEPHYDRRRRAVFNEIQVRQINDLITERIGALTTEEVARIAEAAADKAVDKMTAQAYQMIGKTVAQKMFWLLGLLTVAVVVWAVKNGWIKP
jgi:type III secretory pathway lipoprotein EscJ